jgi:hypothetical protein
VKKHRRKKTFGGAELPHAPSKKKKKKNCPTLCKSIEKAFGAVVSIIY